RTSGAGHPLRWLSAALVASLGLVGCGQKANPDDLEAAKEPHPGSARAAAKPETVPAAPPAQAPAPKRDALHQSFADATRAADNPPADVNRPPDETVTRKAVHRLLADVQARWDEVRFTTAGGKKVHYCVTLHTGEGDIQISLFPDLA